ncbi:MAG TPA: hypothetical protein PLT47_07455, partial [Bacteroidales bacterium]|nr:hypothetical protein [Bacteroidales bacterium]
GATGATVTGLPAGVNGSWASNTVTISGTPTVSGSFTYTVTLNGGCGAVSTTGSITVTPDNTIALTSAAGTNAQTKCINTAITNITYGTTGATGATVTGLPAGVTSTFASNMVTISGTPTASGTFTYTVTLNGGCGAVASSGTITVIPDNTISLISGGAQTKCINTALTTITYATSGATGATVAGLPAGVTGAWSSNVVTISGTPTISGTYTYTVTLTGGCGIITATETITVIPDNTVALTSAAGTDAQSVCINAPITTISYATTGATAVTVSGLPIGITGAWASNALTISGTPTNSGTYVYTVSLAGGCGTITTTGTITVNPSFSVSVTIQAFDNPTCSHSVVNFTTIPVNGGSAPAYQWYLNSNPLLGQNSSTYSNISLNNGDQVYCLLTSSLACTTNNPAISNTVTMVIGTIPIVEAGATATYTGTPVQIGDANNGPGTITWQPAAGLSNAWSAQPLASPSVTTTYTLTVDNSGCVRTDTVTVYVNLYRIISGKTRYMGKALAGNPAPNLPTYNAVKYNIDGVIVTLKTNPGGIEVTRDTSDAQGYYELGAVPDGNYILSYDKYTVDTMQSGNEVNAVDIALMKYMVGHDTMIDPSRNFKAKYRRAINVDNNILINAVDVARIKGKVGAPYDPTKNFPKGNWVAFDTAVTVAGSDMNITLKTI